MARLRVSVLVLMLLLTACGMVDQNGKPIPSPIQVAVAPVLDGWRQAGLSCGSPRVGMPDDLPQWSCQGRLRDVAVSMEFMGDASGVLDLEVDLPPGTDRAIAISAFRAFVLATRAFAVARSDIVDWIGGWNGLAGQLSTEVAGARVTIFSDAAWIGLVIARVPRVASAPS